MLRAARLFWLAFSIAALISASSATLADSGAFSHFAASFRGTGEVQLSDGHRERIACRANDVIGGGGRTMSQNIVCASDSYKFDIRGQVVAAGTEVSCDWQEMTRGVSGAVTGRISDDRFNGAINAAGFAAAFTLRVAGRNLAFGLRPNGSDVLRVDVSLSR